MLSTLTDANGNVTSYAYDGFDRVVETHYPQAAGGQASATDYERLGYDAGGNVVSRRLRDGQMLSYGYDALGRRVSDDLPDTNVAERDVAYAYDNLGALVRAQDTNGWYSAYGYDALGRVTAESSNVFGNAYQYDAGGRLTRQQWQDGFFVDYDYDVTGNMTAVRENGATSGIEVLARYSYDDLGRRTGLVRGNGTTTAYGYDAALRLSSLSHDMAGTAYDVTYGFSYNAGGQIASTTRSNDVYAHAHTDRDEASTINGLNQATSVGGATLTYDLRGNLTDPGGTPYTFDTRNQLYTDGTHLLYRGPGGLLGQEIWGPEQHAFDHARGQLATEFGYGNGGQFRRFVYGPGTDEPLVWYEGQGTTDRRWLHADERGSVVAVSDASGVVTAVNTYDDYGVPGAGNVGRLQYTAQMWLPALGLYDYKARMYAPRLGRFLQTDPIGYGGGMNWYGYVGGDPVNWSDPTGLRTVACPAGWSCDPRGGLIECVVPALCKDDIPVNGKRRNVDLPSRPEPLPRNPVEPTGGAPQRVNVDKSCAKLPVANDPFVQAAALRAIAAGIATGAENATIVGHKPRHGPASVSSLITSDDARGITTDRINTALANIASQGYTPILLIHSHQNNPPPSPIGPTDIASSRNRGLPYAAIDRAGNLTCHVPGVQ